MTNVLAPKLSVGDLSGMYEHEGAMVLLEWLHMVALNSLRPQQSDTIDPFLSRYEVPHLGKEIEARDMVRLRWRGFIPPQFAREVFLAARREGLRTEKGLNDVESATQAAKEERWLALSAQGFVKDDSYTVMQFAGRETLSWEPST